MKFQELVIFTLLTPVPILDVASEVNIKLAFTDWLVNNLIQNCIPKFKQKSLIHEKTGDLPEKINIFLQFNIFC